MIHGFNRSLFWLVKLVAILVALISLSEGLDGLITFFLFIIAFILPCVCVAWALAKVATGLIDTTVTSFPSETIFRKYDHSNLELYEDPDTKVGLVAYPRERKSQFVRAPFFFIFEVLRVLADASMVFFCLWFLSKLGALGYHSLSHAVFLLWAVLGCAAQVITFRIASELDKEEFPGPAFRPASALIIFLIINFSMQGKVMGLSSNVDNADLVFTTSVVLLGAVLLSVFSYSATNAYERIVQAQRTPSPKRFKRVDSRWVANADEIGGLPTANDSGGIQTNISYDNTLETQAARGIVLEDSDSAEPVAKVRHKTKLRKAGPAGARSKIVRSRAPRKSAKPKQKR